MKASNHPLSKIKSKLCSLLPLAAIKELSISTGFWVRAPRKITALDFVLSFFMCCSARKATLSNWASQLCILNSSTERKDAPSRQAICKRLTEASSAFAEALLTRLLSSRISTITEKITRTRKSNRGILSSFSAVLIQDSTTISLADSLSSSFKGSIRWGIAKAVARIQCIIDIKTMQFIHLHLGSFCDNDQGAASMIHHLVLKGTLVLRDLGYFATSSLTEIARSGGYYLSRFKYGLNLYSVGDKELQFRGLLKSSSLVRNINVLAGKKHRMPVRLIIIPLSPQAAAERRRRARVERDKRLNHSKEYMLSLGYHLLLTNVGEDLWTAEQAAEVYRLRWTIECVFKGFKGAGLHMKEICEGITVNAERVRSTLLLALCFIVIQVTAIYRLLKLEISEVAGKAKKKRKKGQEAKQLHMSMNRMIDWICSNFILWLTSPPQLQIQYLQIFCSYEHRKDRTNIAQHLQHAFALS